jgi:hypothetical protein
MRELFQRATHSGRSQGKSEPHHSHLAPMKTFHHSFSLSHMAVILALFLASVSPVQAKPHWKRIAVKAAVLAGASVLQYKATTYCQRGNVEHCIEGYGSRRAFNWISVGMGGAMIAASEKCHKDDGPKPACYGLAYWVPATQTALGIHDFLNYQPKRKKE